MKDATDIGKNRTGIGTAPKMSEQAIAGAREGLPPATPAADGIAAVRASYVREAEPVGSVPPPTSVSGILKTAAAMVTGAKPAAFLDKLAARLAFERSGTRLYEAVLAKARAADAMPSGVSVERLQHFRDEEAAHFRLLTECIESLGADPTVQTPTADVYGVASSGLFQVVSDPRTTVPQSLEALLVAELTDHDGWESLTALADGLGYDDMAGRFRQALRAEQEHLATVRGWVSEALRREAGASPPSP
jgi:rubrerythrin